MTIILLPAFGLLVMAAAIAAGLGLHHRYPVPKSVLRSLVREGKACLFPSRSIISHARVNETLPDEGVSLRDLHGRNLYGEEPMPWRDDYQVSPWRHAFRDLTPDEIKSDLDAGAAVWLS